jgi:hypothetical protein
MATRLTSFAKDVQLATAGIAPQNIAVELARFARAELARVIASGEGNPEYERYVNGNKGAIEDTVIPPGPILYVFSWWGPIIEYALQYVVERSPRKSGRYRRSWFAMADGVPVANPRLVPVGAEVIITNNQPYHRKIDVGHMKMSVPPGVIEDGRKAVRRIFGNMITVRQTMITLPGGYILKGRFRRGHRQFARRGLRKDTMAGAAMTYPALVLTMKL